MDSKIERSSQKENKIQVLTVCGTLGVYTSALMCLNKNALEQT